jgi:lactate dehydrogenase-like 2-hydroxyacid dehydrogenase
VIRGKRCLRADIAARGPCIEEQALVDALASGKGRSTAGCVESSELTCLLVRRAALDVFEHEPNVHADLLSNPNVVSLAIHPLCPQPLYRANQRTLTFTEPADALAT